MNEPRISKKTGLPVQARNYTKKTGRPLVWDEKYSHMAYVATKSGGIIDTDLAEMFKITVVTLNAWKKEYPEFSKALKKGKDEYDCLNAENSMLKRVLGYDYTETVREPDKNGEMVVVRKTTKHLPPDVKAAETWMCNRHPDRWRKLKHVELTGKDGGAVAITGIEIVLKSPQNAKNITT